MQVWSDPPASHRDLLVSCLTRALVADGELQIIWCHCAALGALLAPVCMWGPLKSSHCTRSVSYYEVMHSIAYLGAQKHLRPHPLKL